MCKNKAKAKAKGPVKTKKQAKAKAEGSGRADDKEIVKSVTMSLTQEKTRRLEIHGRMAGGRKMFIVTMTKGDLETIGRAVAKEVRATIIMVCVFVFV